MSDSLDTRSTSNADVAIIRTLSEIEKHLSFIHQALRPLESNRFALMQLLGEIAGLLQGDDDEGSGPVPPEDFSILSDPE